jgi:hypothetical protein
MDFDATLEENQSWAITAASNPSPKPIPMKKRADAAGLDFAPDHEPSVWLGKAISNLRARIMAGSIKICPHLRPGIVAVTAPWAPDRLVYTPSVDMLAASGDEDRKCDRCRVLAESGQIHPAMTSLDATGAVLVLLGLCAACSRREVAAWPPQTDPGGGPLPRPEADIGTFCIRCFVRLPGFWVVHK